MGIKKILRIASFAMFLAIALPANSSTLPASSSLPVKTEDVRAQQLIQRLEDIKNMDKSALTSKERKGLRKEVKGIRKEMKAIKGGVYLSVGAIIIIILLLILIL